MKLRIRYLVEEKNLVYVACHVAGKKVEKASLP